MPTIIGYEQSHPSIAPNRAAFSCLSVLATVVLPESRTNLDDEIIREYRECLPREFSDKDSLQQKRSGSTNRSPSSVKVKIVKELVRRP